ncbi:uncharacterized protein TNCV_3485381 [Trichonephila clavipes]|nr:uncharacterized protein TNCV_3485381 [Trichonephila clavipes]
MAPYTITGAVGCCRAKAGLRRSPWGLRTQTRLPSLLRFNLDSSLKTIWSHFAAAQFSPRRLRMVRKDTGAPSEGATCAWMVADEAVGCTRAFLTMWVSSQRLVCRGCPEPDFRVLDESRSFFRVHTGYFSNIRSFRLRGLSPEFGLLKENSRKGTKMPTEQEAKPAVVTPSLQQLRSPSTFRGVPGEDPLKWLKEFDRVANFNKWDDMMCLANVYFFLDRTARQ